MTEKASTLICCETPEFQEAARLLAKRLDLPLRSGSPEERQGNWVLQLGATGLALSCPAQLASIQAPLRIDFADGKTGHRRRQPGQELLHRAFGLHRGRRPLILDCTGGLGRDAFLLAWSGCRLVVAERHPILLALLEDGLGRARALPATSQAAARITLVATDSREILRQALDSGTILEAAYLDPMFPQREKRAKVKKEAQFLQLLAGTDPDSGELLSLARQCVGRVVVKRPVNAATLTRDQPAYSLKGKTVRFDIYLQRLSPTQTGTPEQRFTGQRPCPGPPAWCRAAHRLA